MSSDTQSFSQLTNERRRTLERRLKGFWALYKREKLGMLGLVMLIFFVFIALFAPFLTPYEPSQNARVAAPFSAPYVMRIFDPLSFDNINSALINDNFALGDAFWSYGVSDGYEDVFSGGVVNDSSSLDGAYKISFNNSLGTVLYDEDTQANITTSIPWGYEKRPAQVYVYFMIRVELTGGYTQNDFDLLIYSGDQLRGDWELISQMYSPFGTTSYLERRASFTYLQIFTSFYNNPASVPFSIQIKDIREGLNGTISVYIDSVRVEIRDKYWGILGTTNTGADAFAQLLYGTRVSLVIGIMSTVIAITIGVFVGMISGYFGGRIDELLMRVVDFLLVIPRLPLLLVLATILGPSFINIILIIGLLGWDGTARLIRAQVLSERNKAYVESARAIGASDTYIIFRHILPNVTPLLFVNITLGVVGGILSEAGLSFLGLGDPSVASWGIMLQNAFNAGGLTAGAWWFFFPPGLGILFLSLSFTFIGYAMDTVLNPKLRTR